VIKIENRHKPLHMANRPSIGIDRQKQLNETQR